MQTRKRKAKEKQEKKKTNAKLNDENIQIYILHDKYAMENKREKKQKKKKYKKT